MILCHRGDGSHRSGSSGNTANIDLGGHLAVGILLRAVAGDVTSLAALVAALAGSVERTAVGGRAVARNVTKLAAGIALHGLSLAITSVVIGTTALVASGRARSACEPTASGESAGESAAAHWSAAAHGANGVGASASKMTRLATVVAAAAGGVAAQAKSRTVGLDVAEALAVIALLSLGGARKRAAIGFVAGLLAVVAKPLSRGADLGVVANVATFVASSTGKRRHCELNGSKGFLERKLKITKERVGSDKKGEKKVR